MENFLMKYNDLSQNNIFFIGSEGKCEIITTQSHWSKNIIDYNKIWNDAIVWNVPIYKQFFEQSALSAQTNQIMIHEVNVI